MLIFLASLAHASTVDLQLTLGLEGDSCELALSDVSDGATINLAQRFGRHDYEVDLTVNRSDDGAVVVQATLLRSDTGEVVTRGSLLTPVGEPANLWVWREAKHPAPFHLGIVANESA